MSIQEWTNITSLSVSIVVSMFMTYHYKRYQLKVFIPLLFTISGFIYNIFGSCEFSDIVYDVAIVISMLILLQCHCITLICTQDCGKRTK